MCMVWLLVGIHMMDQNASSALSGDVLAALPTLATRPATAGNDNHTASFNPQPYRMAVAPQP